MQGAQGICQMTHGQLTQSWFESEVIGMKEVTNKHLLVHSTGAILQRGGLELEERQCFVWNWSHAWWLIHFVSHEAAKLPFSPAQTAPTHARQVFTYVCSQRTINFPLGVTKTLRDYCLSRPHTGLRHYELPWKENERRQKGSLISAGYS